MAGRKRAASTETVSEAITLGLETGDPRNPNSGKRPKRVPMGVGRNLELYTDGARDENFYYHWIAEHPDRGGRLEQAKQAGYEHVTNAEGNQITRRSGNGMMYYMRLPMEYRQEDLALRRKRSEAQMAEQTRLGKNEYAPTRTHREGGSSSIVERQHSDNPYAA